jgi:hypothetical protein
LEGESRKADALQRNLPVLKLNYVLIKELQSLCLDVELIERKNEKERVIGLEKISSAR